jgi:hypothetical protein
MPRSLRLSAAPSDILLAGPDDLIYREPLRSYAPHGARPTVETDPLDEIKSPTQQLNCTAL